jgi:DNA invertase Pin-like site-specific DNA recombinase
MKTALLLRVSTQGQAKADRAGIDAQRAACLEYAARNGLEVVGEFVDAKSGSYDDRPDFYRLLGDAHLYDAVTVYDLTRVARDEELSHRYLRLMHEAGLEVHSVNRGLIERSFMTSVDIAYSAEEKRKIANRLMGAKIFIAKNEFLPQSIQLFGYRHVQRRAIVVPQEAQIISRIYDMSASGSTYYAIESAFNAEGVPTPGKLRKGKDNPWIRNYIAALVRNPAYKGEYQWKSKGGTIVVPIPAIVSPELWETAQQRKRGPPSYTGWPLVGHLHCGYCGLRMSGFRQDKGDAATRRRGVKYIWENYACNSKGVPGKRCGLPRMSRKRLEAQVEAELRALCADTDLLRQALTNALEQQPVVNPEVEALKQQDAGWLEAFRARAITATELRDYRAEIATRLRALATPAPVSLPVERLRREAESASFADLLKVTQARVTVVPDEISIALGL